MELETLVQKIEMYVDQHLPRYIEELRLLCAIDSGSEHKPGLDHIAMLLATRMQKLGMAVSVIENRFSGNDVVGTLFGKGKGKITLLGHIDTVYPVGTAEQRPLQIKGTQLSAPGASDMKGCILSALYALEAITTLQYNDFSEVRLLCVSDEETSHRHSVQLIQQVCHGCDAVLVLEAARENGAIVSARKGSAWYKLTAQGRSAHAGVEPEKGANAIIELAHQVLQFDSLHHYLEGLTVCPGEIHGGTVPNVVPELAQARFDLRYLHAADRMIIENIWREMLHNKRIPDIRLHLELEAYRDPMTCNQETFALLEEAQMIAHHLSFSVEHVLTGGSSDGRFATELGIPVLDGLGPIGGLDHSPHEYLLLDSVAPRAALVAGLIATVGVHARLPLAVFA